MNVSLISFSAGSVANLAFTWHQAVAWVMEQWLILLLVLLLLWPRPSPATIGQQLPVFVGLLFIALPLTSLALRAGLAGV